MFLPKNVISPIHSNIEINEQTLDACVRRRKKSIANILLIILSFGRYNVTIYKIGI